MITGYTISSVKDLEKYKNLKNVQFTLNGRIYPSKRKTLELLSDLPKCSDTKIWVHYDFIYIISRFCLFTGEVQNAIMEEVHDVMVAAERDSRIKGIIMHTDWPLKKEVYISPSLEKIQDHYSSSLWSEERMKRYALGNLQDLMFESFTQFYNKFTKKYPTDWYPIKVYLENTTKVPEIQVPSGTVDDIISYLHKNPEHKRLFGICIDTEHDFAVTGRFPAVLEILEIKETINVDVLVHLNTVPEEVKPKSKKDKHSFTTIFEDSLQSGEDLVMYARVLDLYKIPYVREIKEETIEREQEQIREREQLREQEKLQEYDYNKQHRSL